MAYTQTLATSLNQRKLNENMKDLNPIEIPRINDPKTFECLCKEIIEAIGRSEKSLVT